MSSETCDQSIDEPFSVGHLAKDCEGTDARKPIKDEDKLGTTLVAAVPSSSAPHNRANNYSYTTLPLKLTAYDEKEDFSAWLRRSRFQSLTATQLDKALDAGLSEETPLAQLCTELENLLKPSISKREALDRMYSRRRLIGKSAKEFADDLYCLCKAAFPSISPADCNDAVVYHFTKYIEPPELRRSLLLQPPHDLQDAISRVNHYSTLPNSDVPRQSFLRNNQAQNWRRDDTGNHNRPGPFNRFQYPRRGNYSRFGNRQVCACHSQRSNPSNELAGSAYWFTGTRVEGMPRKSKKTPSSKAPLRQRTKDLCEQLLRLCSSSTDPADGLAYFKNLQVITTELSTLQKDKCLVRNLPKSASERRNFLLRLQSRLGACFLKISMRHILSARSVIAQFPPVLREDPLLCGMENVALSLSLLHELSLGEQSMWYDYLYSLPVSYSTVMYFSAEHMELLSGFPTAGMALNAFRSICRQYAYFFLLFEKTDTLLGNMEFFCFADYCWAVSVVMSRNNRLPDPDCPEKEILCLIPLWDMINHRAGRVTTDVDVETKMIEFYAMEACPPSSEVFMDYGRRTSAEFLLYCGFVPPSNPHHRTPLVLSLSKFDKLLQRRTDLLRRLGYPPEISPLVACNDVIIPSSETACFARVFVMNEDELRQYTEDVEKDFISGSKRLLSTEFDQTRVDTSALTFLETRVDLLMKKYTSNLAKTTGQVMTSESGDCDANFLSSQCRLLCEQDIALLRAYRDALSATRKRQQHPDASSTVD
ncbi:Histone-lysine N-methyltransferase setd3 [Sparganum proliferum]